MAAALEQHPDCGLCTSKLRVIDENGATIPRWWESTRIAQFLGPLQNTTHVRKAPIDAILATALQSIHVSVTQLLLRRRLFKQVGLFRTDLGSAADVEWSIRCGFVSNTLYLPESLATWRVHSQQATTTQLRSSDRARLHLRLLGEALAWIEHNAAPRSLPLPRKAWLQADTAELCLTSYAEARTRSARLALAVQMLLKPPSVLHLMIRERLRGRQPPRFDSTDYMRSLLAKLNLTHQIAVVP